MTRSITLAAVVLALTPTLAAAASPPCLTPGELAAAARFALPEAITGAGTRCGAALPDGAYLKRHGADLAARYAQGADAAWPAVKAALLRVTPDTGDYAGALVRQTSDAELKAFVRGAVASGITAQLPLDRCPAVDTLLRLLAPLPADSTAEVVAAVVGLAATRTRRLGPIAVCPA